MIYNYLFRSLYVHIYKKKHIFISITRLVRIQLALLSLGLGVLCVRCPKYFFYYLFIFRITQVVEYYGKVYVRQAIFFMTIFMIFKVEMGRKMSAKLWIPSDRCSNGVC